MKRLLQLILVVVCLAFTTKSQAQTASRFDEQFKSIDKELTSWDPIRGKWLSKSLQAMSANQPIPDRTFPEDFSPGEMMRMVPSNTMSNIRVLTQANTQNTNDLLEKDRWNRVNNYLYRPDCNLTMGRTYGDPHLKSFDGATYSFQTVGEFVLSSANNGIFEVQVRQEPQSDDFSLNTAVAMQVGGDRVGIYADNRCSGGGSPLMVNGFSVQTIGQTYYLPHGGTIRQTGKNYLVTWPTGERVSVDMDRTGGMNFMNVAVQIYPCASYRYSGLLGDANGSRQDDFNIAGGGLSPMFGGSGSVSSQIEKERNAFLAKDFANSFRIQPMNSLFDYCFGQSTMTFTDYSYPRVHRSINDLSVGTRTNARNTCAAAGLTGAELDACIFDQGFLQIPPTPRPVINDPTHNAVLQKIEREVPNVNPPRDIKVAPQTNDGRTVPNTRPVQDNGDVRTEPVTPNTPPTRPTWQSSDTREVPQPSTGTVRPEVNEGGSQNKNDNGNGAIPKPSGTPNPAPIPKVEAKEKEVRSEPSTPTPAPTPRVEKPRPVETPKPAPKPAPTPRVETPRPAPAPTPKPSPKPAPSPAPKPAPKPAPGRGGL
jgi:von Willebrand factor type D domain